MSWLLSLTEHVHQMREQLAVRHRDPEWIKMVDLTPQHDAGLLRLRGRVACSHPGMGVE